LVAFGFGVLVLFAVVALLEGALNAVTAPNVRAIPTISGISLFIFAVLLWIATNYVVLAFMITNGT
jgi:hypothetical protein